MEKKFNELVQDVWSQKIPGTSKFLIVRLMVQSQKFSVEAQIDYWLGMGMLLYLVKQSCPDLANMSRELLKANDGANLAAYKQLLHVIMYVLNIKSLGLKTNSTGISNK